MHHVPVIIIGAGQAGLATAYYLRRQGIEPVLIDAQTGPGGAWQQYWESLTLFSQASFSNLPGMPMPAYDGYPPRDHVVDYFRAWEQRYQCDIRRPYVVRTVEHTGEAFRVHAAPADDFSAAAPIKLTSRNVVVATGTWSAPHVPSVPGTLQGQFWHAANYPGKNTFRGTKVAVVGGGNSGAQIAAELSEVAEVLWLTRRPPRWMPDEIDGAELFRRSRERYVARADGTANGEASEPEVADDLGDIVMVPSVKHARDSGRLQASPMVASLDELEEVNHLIWCTGFNPAWGVVEHLLNQPGPGELVTPAVGGLHLVGFAQANGPGANTIIGVGPYAKQAATAIAATI